MSWKIGNWRLTIYKQHTANKLLYYYFSKYFVHVQEEQTNII